MTVRARALVPIKSISDNEDCYVSSCNTVEKGKCEGKKGSQKCASCRKYKNHIGIPAY